jgi:hypothetical protein
MAQQCTAAMHHTLTIVAHLLCTSPSRCIASKHLRISLLHPASMASKHRPLIDPSKQNSASVGRSPRSRGRQSVGSNSDPTARGDERSPSASEQGGTQQRDNRNGSDDEGEEEAARSDGSDGSDDSDYDGSGSTPRSHSSAGDSQPPHVTCEACGSTASSEECPLVRCGSRGCQLGLHLGCFSENIQPHVSHRSIGREDFVLTPWRVKCASQLFGNQVRWSWSWRSLLPFLTRSGSHCAQCSRCTHRDGGPACCASACGFWSNALFFWGLAVYDRVRAAKLFIKETRIGSLFGLVVSAAFIAASQLDGAQRWHPLFANSNCSDGNFTRPLWTGVTVPVVLADGTISPMRTRFYPQEGRQ